MADYPPFMNAYGNIPKILDKIKEAKTPERFTVDFLGTNLGFSGGSSRAFIPLAKRIGMLGADGAPTQLYRAFRNTSSSGAAMARAIRTGYPTLFSRNEYAHKLDAGKLEGLVMEATGLEKGASTLRSIVNTFEALRRYADFDATDTKIDGQDATPELRAPMVVADPIRKVEPRSKLLTRVEPFVLHHT